MKKSFVLIAADESSAPAYYPAVGTEEEISSSVGQKLSDGKTITGYIAKETLIGLVVAIEQFEKGK